MENEENKVKEGETIYAFDNDVMKGLATAREKIEGMNRPRVVKGRDENGKRIRKKKEKKKKGDAFWENLADF